MAAAAVALAVLVHYCLLCNVFGSCCLVVMQLLSRCCFPQWRAQRAQPQQPPGGEAATVGGTAAGVGSGTAAAPSSVWHDVLIACAEVHTDLLLAYLETGDGGGRGVKWK
jgi:hypothetical protein